MKDRYTIVGTIRIDPRPGERGRAALDDSTLERQLLGLALGGTLDGLPGLLRTAHSQVSRTASRRVLRADLATLAAQLQSEWHDLEAARH